MDRPLPRRWVGDSFARRMDAVRARLASFIAEHPESTLRVEPRHRISGPQPALGDRWHSPVGQAEMNPEIAQYLSEKRCADCGRKVLKTSGELIGSPGWCGPCWTARQDADGPDCIPPSAA